MHVSARYESRVERRVIEVSCLCDVVIADGKHPWLPVSHGLQSCGGLKYGLRFHDIGSLRLPVVYAMTCQFMSFILDALYGFWGILHEVACAEESGFHVIVFQHVKYSVCSYDRYLHALFE